MHLRRKLIYCKVLLERNNFTSGLFATICTFYYIYLRNYIRILRIFFNFNDKQNYGSSPSIKMYWQIHTMCILLPVYIFSSTLYCYFSVLMMSLNCPGTRVQYTCTHGFTIQNYWSLLATISDQSLVCYQTNDMTYPDMIFSMLPSTYGNAISGFPHSVHIAIRDGL